jgi:hypothetical protein
LAIVSFTLRYMAPALGVTMAIAVVIAAVVFWSNAASRSNEAVRTEHLAVLARRACTLQGAPLLDVRNVGVLVTARCGDQRTRVVTARIELIVP